MFLKNKNIIFKIRRSKVTDYAALTHSAQMTPVDVIQKKEPKDIVGYNKMAGF